MKTKVFTVNLYGYLNEEKAEIVKEYQDHNSELISKFSDIYGFEYEAIDIDPELDELINSSDYIIGSLPNKYKYQLISDAVRYKYMIDHPDSIFIDTDLCLFNEDSLEILKAIQEKAESSGCDHLAGEINKNRLFPCNWLMVSAGSIDGGIFKEMYDMLLDRLKVSSYNAYKMSEDSKWKDKLEDYIWTKLWGYAIPRDLDSRKFEMIPYELFQAYSWNGNWKDADVMKPQYLVGCHFFGFAEGRPRLKEFINYHFNENFRADLCGIED